MFEKFICVFVTLVMLAWTMLWLTLGVELTGLHKHIIALIALLPNLIINAHWTSMLIDAYFKRK